MLNLAHKLVTLMVMALILGLFGISAAGLGGRGGAATQPATQSGTADTA
ncbi:hypothetical protein [Cryobacterium psychrophilum]|nr:hypothetical protein [Cryobacterium psychrophilum]TDW29366.1 hypothetical protein EDD25_1060 [Cryobacterium psychrophilum]